MEDWPESYGVLFSSEGLIDGKPLVLLLLVFWLSSAYRALARGDTVTAALYCRHRSLAHRVSAAASLRVV